MSKRPKCTFKNCDNLVMKGPETGRLLSVCQECFDRNRSFEVEMTQRPKVEIMCPGCMVTLDWPYYERKRVRECPACKRKLEIEQGRVVGVSAPPGRPAHR